MFTCNKTNILCKVDGVEKNYYQKPFGRQLEDIKLINNFKQNARIHYVNCKHKATMTAVLKWIRYYKPLQYYAIWPKDGTHYKDDSVQIYYTI